MKKKKDSMNKKVTVGKPTFLYKSVVLVFGSLVVSSVILGTAFVVMTMSEIIK